MDDTQFLQQFEDCTFPVEQWNHRAHVKAAFLYLSAHPFDIALDMMRLGIQRFNAANDVPETETRGYNETTTVAFMHLVAATMNAYGDIFPTPDADTFCDTHSQLMSPNILRLFYSPQRRSHPDAKTKFVEPDLATLPKVDNGS